MKFIAVLLVITALMAVVSCHAKKVKVTVEVDLDHHHCGGSSEQLYSRDFYHATSQLTEVGPLSSIIVDDGVMVTNKLDSIVTIRYVDARDKSQTMRIDPKQSNKIPTKCHMSYITHDGGKTLYSQVKSLVGITDKMTNGDWTIEADKYSKGTIGFYRDSEEASIVLAVIARGASEQLYSQDLSNFDSVSAPACVGNKCTASCASPCFCFSGKCVDGRFNAVASLSSIIVDDSVMVTNKLDSIVTINYVDAQDKEQPMKLDPKQSNKIPTHCKMTSVSNDGNDTKYSEVKSLVGITDKMTNGDWTIEADKYSKGTIGFYRDSEEASIVLAPPSGSI